MKTAIYTFEQFHGMKNIGSSRIRGRWLWENWQKHGQDIGTCEQFVISQKYDAIIFQKVYYPEYAEMIDCIKILDICDADWLHWGGRLVQTAKLCDAITVSSPALKDAVEKFVDIPVHYVPDCVDFSLLPPPKEHTDRKPVVAWFGYAGNYEALDSAIPALEKRGLDLIVISDKVYKPQNFSYLSHVTNLTWNEKTVDRDLQKADIVINPKLTVGRFGYKSDNKTVHAMALGIPVARDDNELDTLMDFETRKFVADSAYKIVKEKYDISVSVTAMKDILSGIKKD